ncbi:MAG: tRNA (N(6)-L-threonylcarbamoyladenosine(37)-C(2))-methylthiotransferase [Euryarchaeota archaeon]|nr:tRNA (N(6)-L-threonylcarbamoyladenosine(37)-C(2))-methylthiotransferase [Euryarchaeota archaeon]
MKVYVSTYGCTMNQGDSEILRALIARRHQLASTPEESDTVVVNSCAVVGFTERKVLKEVRRHKLAGRRVILTGCLPKANPDAALASGADVVLPNTRIAEIGSVIEGRGTGDATAPPKPELPKLRHSNSAIAIVAISEGCLGACSYCATRFARGRLRSFPMESILREVECALEQGYREVQLTSQDTAVYGRDISTSLPELLGELVDLPYEFRIRVGMMNPTFAGEIFDDLLEAFKSRKVYKFLHLPVQSGSDAVLRHMRRGYSVEDFVQLVREFRRHFPDSTLSTDLIVGYPTEGEEDFRKSLELIGEIKPEVLNITRFSPRPGTEAAKLRDLHDWIKKERSRKLTELMRGIGLERNRRYLGRRLRVLVTKHGKHGTLLARSDAYRQVVVREGKIGEFTQVKVREVRPTYLIA